MSQTPTDPQDQRDATEEALLAVLVAMWLRMTREVRAQITLVGGTTWAASTAAAGWVPGTVQQVWDAETSVLDDELMSLGLTPEQAAEVSADVKAGGVTWVEAAVVAVLAAAVLHGWTVTVTLRVVQDVTFGRSTPNSRLVVLPPGVPTSVDLALVHAARDLATRTTALDALATGRALGATTKTWRTMHDARVRSAHAVLDGVTVGIDEMFSSGGYSLEYPGDRGHGAPPELTYNCRCTLDTAVPTSPAS